MDLLCTINGTEPSALAAVGLVDAENLEGESKYSQYMHVQSPSQVKLYLHMHIRSYFYSTTCFGLTPSSGTLSLG
jgi:hypothetical protein